SACLQVFGGHGYVREWGIEQIVRDARVAMIYEGTNEIQAIDLLVRKVLADGGQGLATLLTTLPGTAPSPAASARRHALVEITQTLAIAAQSDAELPYWVADDYLRAVALVLLDWAWCQIGAASHGERWNAPAQALTQWVLPEFDMRAAILRQRIAQSLEIKNKSPD
ncbi:MAG: acyl-CoA dehydrogenase, partial [Acidovorax sp.]|nr:acyl-CoA dehydrogenase [Acidovorax sp.]